jgi:hypothetical protein
VFFAFSFAFSIQAFIARISTQILRYAQNDKNRYIFTTNSEVLQKKRKEKSEKQKTPTGR